MAPARPPSSVERFAGQRDGYVFKSGDAASATTRGNRSGAAAASGSGRSTGPAHSRPTAVLRRRARPPHAHRRRRTLQRSAHITLTARRAEVAAVVPGR